MSRPTGRRRDARFDQASGWWWNVRTAGGADAVAFEREGQVGQPVFVGGGVIVEECEDFAGGFTRPVVACGAQAAMVNAEVSHVAEFGGGLGDGVSRAIVDDQDFEVRINQPLERGEGGAERARAVVSADDDREAGLLAQPHGLARALEVGKPRPKRGTGLSFAPGPGDQAKPPRLRNIAATREPLVSPGKYNLPCNPGAQARLPTPVKRLGLGAFPVTPGIKPEFTDDQWFISGDVLEAPEVPFVVRAIFEVDVAGEEVCVPRAEIFGGWVGGIGIKRGGVGPPADSNQPFKEPPHTVMSHPADQFGRDLIGHDEPEHAGSAPHLADDAPRFPQDPPGARPVAEEIRVRRPAEADQHTQVLRCARLEEPFRRRDMKPHCVEPKRRDLTEVGEDAIRCRQTVGSVERAVAYPLEQPFFSTEPKEFSGGSDLVAGSDNGRHQAAH